jgi:3-deoxy-D-manno-octulosonic-acid transferase
MTVFLYRFLFYPLAFVLLQTLRPLLNRKAKEMIRDKNQRFFKFNAGSKDQMAAKRPFWIHAASGEIEYARPVIRELKKRFPGVPVIVTHSSPSAKKILSGLADVDAWGALPWDIKGHCERFLNEWQPRALLIARTDAWPVMATCCKERRIPSLLFAATFAENSSRLAGFSGRVTEWALNQLATIHCVSAEDENQLKRLHVVTPVEVRGDTRFDQVFHRLENPKPVKSVLRPPLEPVLIAGSTWPEDESVLIPAFKGFKGQCKLVLVPHEIHSAHLENLEKLLTQNGLSCGRYSQLTSWQQQDVLLVDEIGILAELYAWGTLAFVGGSFKKQVHSVMEPLAAGLPVLVGPFHANNREALHFKNIQIAGIPVVQEAHGPTEMNDKLQKLVLNLPVEFKSRLQNDLQKNRFSTKHVLDWCESYGMR